MPRFRFTMVFALITAPALADTLTCSQWQGIRTCQSPITVTRVTPFNFGFQVRF